jgi:hypothetical protein
MFNSMVRDFQNLETNSLLEYILTVLKYGHIFNKYIVIMSER